MTEWDKMQAMDSFKEPGADHLSFVKKMIGRLLISRCSQSAQTSILASFQTEACRKLLMGYDTIAFGNPPEMPNGVWVELRNLADNSSTAVYDIAHLVSPENIEPQIATPDVEDNKLPLDSDLYKNLFADLANSAEKRVAANT